MNPRNRLSRAVVAGLLGAIVMIGCGDDSSDPPELEGRALCVESFDDSENFELRDSDSGEVFYSPQSVSLESGSDRSTFEITYLESGDSASVNRCTSDDSTEEPIDESVDTEVSSTTEITTAETMPDESTTSIGRATTTQVRTSGGTTTVARATTTMGPYGTTTTSYVPSGPPTGTWIRNDGRCSWRGTSSCGVYSGGDGQWEEVGPSGGPGSTFTPIAGTSGQIAYNLYSGNSIQGCDWNGTGECGWYFTGTPGTYNMGPVG